MSQELTPQQAVNCMKLLLALPPDCTPEEYRRTAQQLAALVVRQGIQGATPGDPEVCASDDGLSFVAACLVVAPQSIVQLDRAQVPVLKYPEFQPKDGCFYWWRASKHAHWFPVFVRRGRVLFPGFSDAPTVEKRAGEWWSEQMHQPSDRELPEPPGEPIDAIE